MTCAYHLARLGHRVTVFEAQDKPGGILRYGIPKYRLPKDILDREINDIVSLGVKIKCNKKVGKDISWIDLDKYDAVFIGTGCHKERRLFDVDEAKGFFPSLKYLTLSAKNSTKGFGKTTAVIGGGNSAIDAARTALRHGSKVTLFYHRSKEEMPAFEEEILDAQKEGVDFQFLVQPVDIVIKKGKVKELKLRKTTLGKPDESGRRRPEPVLGSDFTFKVDSVIPAIGETADFDILPKKLRNDGWKLEVDEFGRTNLDKIFAGGDTALDDHNIAAAIGSGKAAALAIDANLKGLDIDTIKDKIFIGNNSGVSALKYNTLHNNSPAPEVLNKVAGYEDLNKAYFNRQSRVKKEKLEITKRQKSFDEVCKTLGTEAVATEAERCFHCGVCTLCDNCLKFCPDVSVIKRADGTGYDIDLDYCKGCGVCVNECPRSAMFMEEDL